ncbi:MAG: CoxG family protein [Hyphomicrobiales bacterium]
MKMSGEEVIPAAREAVWTALNDPDVLKKAIPGCQEIHKTSDTDFDAKVVVKIGPVKATFTGLVHLSDLNPPASYRISGEGKGGVAGFASGGASVRLDEVSEGTKLSYDVDAQVGGKLASLGSRLIDSTARSLATQFFERFAAIASGGPSAPEPVPSGETPAKKSILGLFKRS